jgi:phosphohistidine phosphatase SixA
MLLALIRHGIAEDAGPATGYRDEPRRLTEEGALRMRSAAQGIARLGIHPGVVLTSPLARCVQTAEIVAAATGADVRVHAALRPGARAGAVLDLLAGYPDADCVAVCGHQPDMSDITADLSGSQVNYRRGMLGVIDLAALRPRAGVLVGLYPPKALRALGAREAGGL